MTVRLSFTCNFGMLGLKQYIFWENPEDHNNYVCAGYTNSFYTIYAQLMMLKLVKVDRA